MNTIKKQLLAGVLLAAVLAPASTEAFCPSITTFFASAQTLLQNLCKRILREQIAHTAARDFKTKTDVLTSIVTTGKGPRNEQSVWELRHSPHPNQFPMCCACTNKDCENYSTINDIKKIDADIEKTIYAQKIIDDGKKGLNLCKLKSARHKNIIDILEEEDKISEEITKE